MGIVVPHENIFQARTRGRTLTKVRSAGDWYAVALERDLFAGQVLTGAPTLRVLRWETAEDVTTEFHDAQPTYGTVQVGGEAQRCIRFWLPAATGDEQRPGKYAVEALFETSEGRLPAGVNVGGHLPLLVIR